MSNPQWFEGNFIQDTCREMEDYVSEQRSTNDSPTLWQWLEKHSSEWIKQNSIRRQS
jgi:hypothetical protein